MLKWCQSFADLKIEGEYIKEEDEKFILSAIPESLKGKTVLDLASFDGYYSYVASKRGAKTVMAIDNGLGEEILAGPDNGVCSPTMSFPNVEENKKAISRLYEKYTLLNESGANIHFVPMDVFDIDKIIMDFDIIFCFGLYYHVKDIYGLFERCYRKCKEMTIVEGVYTVLEPDASLLYLCNPFELHNDPTNIWSPTPIALVKLLLRVGFSKVESMGTRNSRILLRCFK